MKVGDYVRTVGGFIGKVISKKGSCTTYRIPNMQEDDILEIIKSSSNIMNLIKIGDYVNGCEVLDIFNYNNCDSHLIVNGNGFNVIMINDIKSIVTHEQFESIQYNLESEVN